MKTTDENSRGKGRASRVRLFVMAVLPVAILALGYVGYDRMMHPEKYRGASASAGHARSAATRHGGRARRRGPIGPRYGRGGAGFAPARERRAPVVETMKARLEDYRPLYSFYGQITAPLKADISSQVSGRLVHISPLLRPGGRVRKGQLVAQVDDFAPRTALDEALAAVEEMRGKISETRAQTAQEEGALKNAREQLDLALSDLRRVRGLSKSGTASQKALENTELTAAQRRLSILQHQSALRMARARLKQYQAQLESRKLAVARARHDLEQTRLRAPFDGVILSASAALGQYVTPSTRLAQMIPDGGREVRFSMSEDRYGDLLANGGRIIGAPVRVIWKSGRARVEMRGEIARIAPQLDADSGSVTLFAALDADGKNARALRNGSFADVLLSAPPLRNVARLPEGALHGKDTLFTLDKGRLKPLKVRPLLWENGEVIVSGPLAADADIVISHLPNAKAGMRVRVVRR